MAQEYVLRSFKKGDYQDAHGNYWCDAAFEGFGEPVRWVVKDPLKIKEGESYYGEIKEMTSQAGKPYMRFYKQIRTEDGTPSGGSQGAPKGSGWKDTSDGQRQGMCINNAAAFICAQNTENAMGAVDWAKLVHEYAAALYALGDLAKPVEDPPMKRSLTETFNTLRATTQAPDDVAPYTDEPINLDDIPF